MTATATKTDLSGMFGIAPAETTETIRFTLWESHREELTKYRAALDDALNAIDDLLAGEITPEARAAIRAHTNGFGEWKPVDTTTVPGILYDVRSGDYASGDPTEEEADDADAIEQADFAGDEDRGHEEALFGDC